MIFTRWIIMFLLCTSAACWLPTSLIGVWKLKGYDYPKFTIDETKIVSKTNSSIVSMQPVSCVLLNNQIQIELKGIEVIKKPSDWYNLSKYYFFITHYNLVKKMGLTIFIRLVQNNEAEVNCMIGENHIGQSFTLIKSCILDEN